MAAPDAFKPASGTKEVSVQGQQMAGPQLGDHFRIQAQPHPVQPAPRTVAQGGAQFVPASQQVQMAGALPQAPPQNPGAAPGDKFQPASPPQQLLQQQQQQPQTPAAPALAAPQQPPQPPAPPTAIRVCQDAVGPDGAKYTAAYIAEFPAGAQLSGPPRLEQVG